MKKNKEKLRAEFIAEAEELFDEMMAWNDETNEPDLTQIEDIVLKLRERFGEQIAQKILQQQEKRQPAEKAICPACGREMESKGLKKNQVETRIGNLKIKRNHYYCPPCQQGIFPPGSAAEDLGEALE